VGDDAELQKEIRENCINLLTRREHSLLELQNKLALKGFNRLEVGTVVGVLAEQGWQSNQRFAESYARHRIKKGFGPIKIAYELKQKGVENLNLDEVVLEVTGDWDTLLEQVYLKKYSEQVELTKQQWFSQTRFLQQRGFNGEMIKNLFDRLGLKLIYS